MKANFYRKSLRFVLAALCLTVVAMTASSPAFAQEHPEAVRRFVAALHDAVNQANAISQQAFGGLNLPGMPGLPGLSE